VSYEIRPKDLEKYKLWLPDRHTRNKIFRNDLVEAMLICWPIGAITPLHTHNGQLGWMSVESGALAVVNYKWLGCNAADNQNVAGMDCLAGATELDIDRREVQECFPGGPINTVDKVQTIHQVVVQGKEPVVSLHLYSRPIDSCVAFDLERKMCYRRELTYYSKYGDVVVREGDLQPPAGLTALPVVAPRR
jgi:cysteine dioxygenase